VAEKVVSGLRPSVHKPHPIERVEWIPSGGGIFDIHLDGELIFSKFKEHRDADPREILELVRMRLK